MEKLPQRKLNYRPYSLENSDRSENFLEDNSSGMMIQEFFNGIHDSKRMKGDGTKC